MVRTIDVPDDLDRSLATLAEREGTSVEALTVEILRRSTTDEAKAADPLDILEFWRREGVIGSRSDIIDSVEHARRLREASQHRQDRP